WYWCNPAVGPKPPPAAGVLPLGDGLGDAAADALGGGLTGEPGPSGRSSGEFADAPAAADRPTRCPLWTIANPDASSAQAATPTTMSTHVRLCKPARCRATV